MRKINRQAVFDKFGGHCAYCGRDIGIKQMQVDHIAPKYRTFDNGIENLNPSCAYCNHYKGGFEIESFRQNLMQLDLTLAKTHKVRVAEGYGIVTIKPWDGVFYFEKVKEA